MGKRSYPYLIKNSIIFINWSFIRFNMDCKHRNKTNTMLSRKMFILIIRY